MSWQSKIKREIRSTFGNQLDRIKELDDRIIFYCPSSFAYKILPEIKKEVKKIDPSLIVTQVGGKGRSFNGIQVKAKSVVKESISQALEGIPVSITCNATDYPSESELIDDDGVIVCSNCWAPFFSLSDDDETNEETKREFLFVHDVRGNINEQNRKYWIVSWENWDAYVGFTYPSKSFYNEEDADKFAETLKKNENNREILKYASTGIPSVPPIYKEEKELKKYDLIKKIRKPLPPQKHSIHKDKTKYDRKRDKKIDLNENIKWNIGDVVELDGYCRSKSMYYYELPYTGLLRVIKIDDRGGHTLKNIETGEVCQTIFMGDCLIKPSVYMESKNIDEARQYAHDGFDVELECSKKNDFGYLVSSTDMDASMKNPEGPWRSKYICSVCGMDSENYRFMDFHKFFGGLMLQERFYGKLPSKRIPYRRGGKFAKAPALTSDEDWGPCPFCNHIIWHPEGIPGDNKPRICPHCGKEIKEDKLLTFQEQNAKYRSDAYMEGYDAAYRDSIKKIKINDPDLVDKIRQVEGKQFEDSGKDYSVTYLRDYYNRLKDGWFEDLEGPIEQTDQVIGSIYGNGGLNRYYVRVRDGAVLFSKFHSARGWPAGKDDLEKAKNVGFLISEARLNDEQKTNRMNETDYELFEEWFSSLKEVNSLKKYYFKGRVSGVAKYLIEKYAFVKKWSHQKIESAISTFFEKKAFDEIVRKVGNEYVLYSKKKDPKTGKRRVLGREKSKEAIEKRERQVQYFKNKG